MARMRTVSATINHFKSIDPETAVTENFLRTQIKLGNIKTVRAGNRYLLNLDLVEEFLSNPPAEEEMHTDYGSLRRCGGGLDR